MPEFQVDIMSFSSHVDEEHGQATAHMWFQITGLTGNLRRCVGIGFPCDQRGETVISGLFANYTRAVGLVLNIDTYYRLFPCEGTQGFFQDVANG